MSEVSLLTEIYLYPSKRIKSAKFGKINGSTIAGATGIPFLAAAEAENDSIGATAEAVLRAVTVTPSIGVVAVFNSGKIARAYRRRHSNEGWDDIPDIEYYSLRGEAKKKLLSLPLSSDLENLFFEIHSAMRDVDGMHPDEALEELCKIIYTRSFEEEQCKDNATRKLSSEQFGTVEEYSAAIRYYYTEAADYDLRVFRLKIPQYERSRGVFNKPIRLSSAALSKCYKMLEVFDLSGSRADVKGRAFQKVLGRGVRSTMGQYFTPGPVCELMTDIVEPKVTDLILDPFCGSGHFLTESLKRVSHSEGKDSKAFHEFAFGKLHGIEKSDRMVRIAMTDMRLNGDGHSNIRCTDALLDFGNYPDLAPDSFDIVITNPPFGSLLGPEALASLGAFEVAKGKKNCPLEIVGLERSLQFLRPGGRLAILLPDSVFSADSTLKLRHWLMARLMPRVIVSLPISTFSPFGANVKTSILFARKMRPGERRDDSKKVCVIQAENVGYDSAGRDIPGIDMADASKAAKSFLSAEGW